MAVRIATLADLPAIAALVNEHARRGQVLPRTMEEIGNSIHNWVVGEEAGELLACGSLLFYTPELAEVRSLIVSDRVQGNGWGRSIVEALIAQAQERGIPALFALTRVVPLFRRLGFVVTERHFFPEKIWRDCQICPIKERCDETAVALHVTLPNQ